MQHFSPQEKAGPGDLRQGGCTRQLGAANRKPPASHLFPGDPFSHLPGLRVTSLDTSHLRHTTLKSHKREQYTNIGAQPSTPKTL